MSLAPFYTGYIILDPDSGMGAYKISGGANGAWWGGAIQGAALGLVLVMASFLAAIAVSGGWMIWIPVAVIVVANVLAMKANLENMSDSEASCYMGGLLTGLGVAGLFNLNSLVGRVLAIFGIYAGYNIDTTSGNTCSA